MSETVKPFILYEVLTSTSVLKAKYVFLVHNGYIFKYWRKYPNDPGFALIDTRINSVYPDSCLHKIESFIP